MKYVALRIVEYVNPSLTIHRDFFYNCAAVPALSSWKGRLEHFCCLGSWKGPTEALEVQSTPMHWVRDLEYTPVNLLTLGFRGCRFEDQRQAVTDPPGSTKQSFR